MEYSGNHIKDSVLQNTFLIEKTRNWESYCNLPLDIMGDVTCKKLCTQHLREQSPSSLFCGQGVGNGYVFFIAPVLMLVYWGIL